MNTSHTSFSYAQFPVAEIADLLLESMSTAHQDALAVGHRPSGDFPKREVLLVLLEDASPTMRKRLLKWHFRLQRKPSRRSVNRFLDYLCAKQLSYGPGQQVPRIDLSEKETAIQAARAAWVQARDNGEALRLAYVAEKGDYYKR